MARLPRLLTFDPAEIGIDQCINRCVRRAILCGFDPVSGKSFEHRRQWLQVRREFVAGVLGCDILGFAAMNNDVHVVVRNRPDVVAARSDEEVSWCWYRFCQVRRDPAGAPAEPTDADLVLITGNADCLLVEWSGCEWRGGIETEAPAIVERLQLDSEGWMDLLQAFHGRFRRAAGRPESLAREAALKGRRWTNGSSTTGSSSGPPGRPILARRDSVWLQEHHEPGHGQARVGKEHLRRSRLRVATVHRCRSREQFIPTSRAMVCVNRRGRKARHSNRETGLFLRTDQ